MGVMFASALAFVGTMIDNFFAFSAQLLVTPERRIRRVSVAQALGVATLVAMAYGVGSILEPVPTRWIGLLAIAPWSLGVHGWRHRDDPIHEHFKRGALTTFVVTIALGGDNLAVWIPLLRSQIASHAVVTLLTFAVFELLFVMLARAVTGHPTVVTWGERHARRIVPWVYLALGFLILIECRTL
jgi:cadmium resistance protein CadD (predicted permease)